MNRNSLCWGTYAPHVRPVADCRSGAEPENATTSGATRTDAVDCILGERAHSGAEPAQFRRRTAVAPSVTHADSSKRL